MRRAMALIAMLGLVGNAWAGEDDPELAAALAKCPGAAAFVRADEQHRQALAQRLAGSVPTEPRLRERLLEMERIDQQARDGDWSPPMIEKMLAVDAANLPEIRSIVADHGGLPRARQVGADGVAAAWLLVQHADGDADFQRQVLDGIMPLVESGEVSAHDFVLLTDRVLVNAGKPQRYGSQLAAVGGKWQPRPMEAPEQVDQRRAAVGQMPLADYLCVASRMFPAPPADADGNIR
ncbi:hypothetical protein CQ393_08780 [Stenotrophomonas sp. MYb238]|uniref:DUF6624 domain-containing protein n=1 Tax=Stenotrophomonas sp. MYb238 TaxID=2040281 RepID=UPI0012916438|nr:DUF6624 domain-containing protein [Stenotrophomonas sp. MYb238]MQP75985.1 hypothetical protein [Stenotrophomonas sp. MYb238]